MPAPIVLGPALWKGIIAAAGLSQTYLHGGKKMPEELSWIEQMLGMITGGIKFPWQTPPEEGFIAPWTPKTQMAGQWAPKTTLPGEIEGQVVKTWTTGTATFYLFTNGRIGCYKKSGVFKTWRPARHIVVPRNPRIGTLIRADKRIDTLMTGLARRTRKLQTRRRQPVKITQADIRALIPLLSAAK